MSVILTPQIQTAEHLSDVLIELREYLNKLRDHVVRKQVAKVQGETLPLLSPAARQVLEANSAMPITVDSLKKLISSLEETRIVAPRMRIMLPAWPDQSVRESLVTHVRKHIHPLVMLNFAVRADMGGGCMLQFGSSRFDFSYRNQLLANKHKISELLNSYAKA